MLLLSLSLSANMKFLAIKEEVKAITEATSVIGHRTSDIQQTKETADIFIDKY